MHERSSSREWAKRADGLTYGCAMSDQAVDAFAFVLDLLDRVDPSDRVDDADLDAWNELADRAEDIALALEDGVLDEVRVAELSTLIAASELSDSHTREAVAWGIDRALWPTFTHLWLAARGGSGPLLPGEWFPVTDVDRELLPDHPTSLPSRLSVRAGELPHVRRFDQVGQVAVHVDHDFAETIDAALASIAHMATIHPNADATDFAVPEARVPLFPVRPGNSDQANRIAGLATEALLRSPVVVGPELACPPVGELEPVRHSFPGLEPRLFVIGSRHEVTDTGERVNRALLLVGPDASLHHHKFAPYIAGDAPEGISPRAPALTMLVSREWRVVIAVCKDLLSPDVVATLCRIGANVVLVPAWSPKLDAFRAAAEMLVSHCHALVLVANGPPRNADDEDIASMLGRPLRADTVRSAPHPCEPTIITWPVWE